MSPGILASFVLAIIISGIISVSVAPMFYEQGETPEVGAGLVQIQRKLHKLETSLEDVRGRLSSLAPASDIWQIKEEQKGILEKQAALGNLMKKELEKLKVQHISNERIKTEVARAIASRADPADYASYNANGRVVGHSDLYPRKGDPWFLPSRDGDWYLFSLPYVQGLPGLFTKGLRRLFPVHPKASIWLLSIPPTGYEVPGHCLPLNGSAGYVDIKLRRKIQLSSVSIEHISKITAFNITTAPREMKIFALNDINGEGSGEPSKGEELASFAYNIESTPVQVFPVETKPKHEVSQIRLEVESNYGSEDYTCLYRFKAYGDPLS
jgi:SUN domain-containing protein 1/2